jgi:hypothetical protein
VLRWLVQKNQEASQTTRKVGQDAFGLFLGVERANAEIGLRRDGARLSNERRADDSVRICVLVAGPWSSGANINLPVVDEASACRYFVSGDVSLTAVLIDKYVVGALSNSARELGF